MSVDPIFIGLADVLQIHRRSIERFGGSDGVRDPNLLDSAAAQPRATFGGEYLHRDHFEMAAAYLFHLVKNHPFVDGNKRAGLAATLVFLDLNGHSIDRPTSVLFDATYGVADGSLTKAAVAEILRDLAGA